MKNAEIISGNKKLYLNDLSFKNYLFPGFQHGLGYMLENLLFLHFRQKGYNVYTGYLRDKEIDFILQKNNELVYIQVAYQLTDEKTINREFGNLESINDNYEKYVISLDDVSFGNKDGIKHVLAWQLD